MINQSRRSDYRDREFARGDEPKPKTKPRALVPTAPAKNLFEKYERIMQESFRALCEAVAEIKNRHYYRLVGYNTFAECCEDRWGWTARRGYQLAEANVTLKSLPAKCVPMVHNERTARALADVPKEKRVEVLKTVAKSGPVTARRIAQASAPIVIDVEPEPEKPIKHCPTCRCA